MAKLFLFTKPQCHCLQSSNQFGRGAGHIKICGPSYKLFLWTLWSNARIFVEKNWWEGYIRKVVIEEYSFKLELQFEHKYSKSSHLTWTHSESNTTW